MLQITVPEQKEFEVYDEELQEFKIIPKKKAVRLNLEHSLVSISKWEAKYKKPFLIKQDRTPEEVLDYIKCMTLTQNVPDEVYARLSEENLKAIQEYWTDTRTATTFPKRKKPRGDRNILTSEVLYYQMIAYQIPWECQKWHINRLQTLIRVCERMNNGEKEIMSKAEVSKMYDSVNEQRRKAMNSKG